MLTNSVNSVDLFYLMFLSDTEIFIILYLSWFNCFKISIK